jgi:hypothetical protein
MYEIGRVAAWQIDSSNTSLKKYVAREYNALLMAYKG